MTDASASWRRVKELVADALELEPERRAGFFAELAGEPEDVRARVRMLVDAAGERAETGADGEPEDPLERGADPRPLGPVDWTGRRVGGYEVKRFVARGGMGEVYEAVQQATGRRVALKVLSGASPGAWRARFRHEVGILARLEHRAIAQILGAEVHVDADGREQPYFALEYVDGEPLTRYADARGLSVEARIELLIEVCGGVQHAHQRGVIHRDLKPENILVAELEGGEAQPKVLDFGVARLAADGDGAGGSTHLTQAGELIGTLSYMSPEQVLGRPEAVDTRTDVHGLGVLLFQLLTGRLPIDLDGAPLPEAVRRLREDRIPAPSSIDPRLGADLDTICATALARDPAARYSSVSELAADLGRYLRREPISARPASRVYHLRMFARRHRGLVAGLAVAAGVLVAGSIGTAVGFVRATDEASRARAEAGRTREANRFLGEILSAADPEALGKDVTVREVLDQNAPRIDAVFADDDRTRAELHTTVGWTYFNLGEPERARAHLSTATELWSRLDGADSEGALAAAVQLQTVAQQVDATSDGALAAAEELEARAIAALGPDHPTALLARGGTAYVLFGRGEYERALGFARANHADAVRALGREADVTSTLGSDLGGLLMGAGEYDAAADLIGVVHAGRVASLGASHPRSISSLISLATALSMAERSDEALAAFDRALEDARATWAPEHPSMLLLRANRASALSGIGRYDEAIDEYRDVHAVRRAALGERNAQTLGARFNLGVNLAYAERFDEAEREGRELLRLAAGCDGCDDDFLMRANGLLAGVLSDAGRRDEAVPFSEVALAEHRRLLGADHFQTLIQGNNHARLLGGLARFDESIELFERTIAAWIEEYPNVQGVLRTIRWNHARVLADAGRREAAEAEFGRVNDLEPEAGPNPRPERDEVLAEMAELYDAWGRASDAEACRAEIASADAAR